MPLVLNKFVLDWEYIGTSSRERNNVYQAFADGKWTGSWRCTGVRIHICNLCFSRGQLSQGARKYIIIFFLFLFFFYPKSLISVEN